MCNNTNRLEKISPVDEKCSLTFYARVHHGSLDPILASEKRAERESCLAYGDILGLSKDGAFPEIATITMEYAVLDSSTVKPKQKDVSI